MGRQGIGLMASVALALGLLVGGCGNGDSSSSGSTSSTLSKQQYVTALEHAVLQLGAATQQLQGVEPRQRQQAASAVAAEDAAFKKASEQIAALDPPSVAVKSNADLVTAINRFENVVAGFEQALQSGTHQDVVAGAQAIAPAQQAFLTTLTQLRSQLKAEGIPLPGP